MKTRPRDILWAAAAGVIIFGVFVSALSVLTGRGDALRILVGLIPASWLGVGCWRRTKWGAPADGLRAWQERRATAHVSDDGPREV
jgi:hypothetical protein